MILDMTFVTAFRRGRAISDIIPDVVLREVNRDDTIVTDHPVETGAAISDHAFMRPFEVEMLCAWGPDSAAYEQLQALQQEREPFDLMSGKRLYQSMLVSSIMLTSDVHTENIFMIAMRFREVIIVSTQTTPGKEAPKSAQNTPSKTGSTVDMGTKTTGFAPPNVRA